MTQWRLEEAEDLLPRGHLLAFKDARARLGDDTLHQGQDLLRLVEQALGSLLGPPPEGCDDLPTLVHHPLAVS